MESENYFIEYNSLSKEDLQKNLSNLEFEFENIRMVIDEENQKFEKYAIENERRQHNYIPLIFDLLKIMSEKNVLEEIYLNAKKEEEKKVKK